MVDKEVMEEKRQKGLGFTLVELLVVMAIFGTILAAVLKVFSVNYQTYTGQEEIAAMHQNVRVAKMFLERDVRMAGCGLKNFYHEDERVYTLVFENANGATGSDKLTINYIDYSNDSCDNILPQITLAGTMPANSAEADVNEDLTTSPYSDWDSEFSCGGNTYGGTPFKPFKAIITAPDGSKSDVVYITQVQANANKIQNRPYAGFNNKVLNSYPAGSTIEFFNEEKLTEVIYDLVDGVLRRNSQPVAENIEDLQFAFGLDTDDNGTVDSWVNNADLTDVEKDQVRLVRISVLGRTSNEHRYHSSTRPAIEDYAGSGTSDGYYRKLLQVTVKVRNLQ